MDGSLFPKAVACPYDAKHLVSPLRLPFHLVKCQKRRGVQETKPDAKSPVEKTSLCPFNANHHLKQGDQSCLSHAQACSERRPVDVSKFHNDCSVASRVERAWWFEQRLKELTEESKGDSDLKEEERSVQVSAIVNENNVTVPEDKQELAHEEDATLLTKNSSGNIPSLKDLKEAEKQVEAWLSKQHSLNPN